MNRPEFAARLLSDCVLGHAFLSDPRSCVLDDGVEDCEDLTKLDDKPLVIGPNDGIKSEGG